MSACGATDRVHGACGGHGGETFLDAARELALTQLEDVLKLLRLDEGRDEVATLGDVGKEFVNRGETIGFVTVAGEGRGHHFEKVFAVGEEEVIFAAEMGVESGAADSSAIEDLLDGDGIEGLFLHEVDEGIAEGVAGLQNPAVHFLPGGTDAEQLVERVTSG